MQRNHIFDLQEHLEQHCDVLPEFDLNSTKSDFSFFKSYLLRILANVRDIERTAIKKANQFIPFKFGDNQLLDLLNFLGGATGFDSFSKAHKTSETKSFFHCEWFDDPDKMQSTELPMYDASVAVVLLKKNTMTMLIY